MNTKYSDYKYREYRTTFDPHGPGSYVTSQGRKDVAGREHAPAESRVARVHPIHSSSSSTGLSRQNRHVTRMWFCPSTKRLAFYDISEPRLAPFLIEGLASTSRAGESPGSLGLRIFFPKVCLLFYSLIPRIFTYYSFKSLDCSQYCHLLFFTFLKVSSKLTAQSKLLCYTCT